MALFLILAVIAVPGAPQIRVNPHDGRSYACIPPGAFLMGYSPEDQACEPDEEPVHRVNITKGFWAGQMEVTVGAYRAYAARAGLQTPELDPTLLAERPPFAARLKRSLSPRRGRLRHNLVY